MDRSPGHIGEENVVQFTVDSVTLEGNLIIPSEAQGLVLFAHGSGSGRHSSRNRYVARMLQEGGLATFLFDLLTLDEEAIDMRTRHLRFDIRLLASRVAGAIDWLSRQTETKDLLIGIFGSSTGAAAALIAAVERVEAVLAVVSRGGRPDLALPVLPQVRAPTLLIVGGNDIPVIGMNEEAFDHLQTEKQLEIIPGASHLFEEPGALEAVAKLAREWFQRYLAK